MSKKEEREKRRKDFEDHQIEIREAYIALLTQLKRPPKLKEVEARTGISIKTIQKHLEKLDLSDLTKDLKIFKVLNHDVTIAIYKSALKGASASQKLWFQLQGWKEGTESTVKGDITIDQKPPVIVKITNKK